MKQFAQVPVALLVAALVMVATATSAQAQRRTQVIPGHSRTIQSNSHALGFTGGFAGATGFTYRHYFGNNFVQANALPLMANRGEFLMMMAGLSAGRYLLLWHSPSMGSIIPSTTAMRALMTTSMSYKSDTTTAKTDVNKEYSLAGGIGFEFGALMSHGFSISFDVMLTSVWDQNGFDFLMPLPYGTVVYNW
jgi:hypothetical protein